MQTAWWRTIVSNIRAVLPSRRVSRAHIRLAVPVFALLAMAWFMATGQAQSPYGEPQLPGRNWDEFYSSPNGTRPYVSPDGRNFDRCSYERDNPSPDTRMYGPPDRVPISAITSPEARQKYTRCAVDPCAPTTTAQCWRRPGEPNQGGPAPPSGIDRQPRVLKVSIPPQFSIFVPGLQNLADQLNFFSTYHPLETAYVGLAVAGGRMAMLPPNAVTVQRIAGAGGPGVIYKGQAAPINIRDQQIARVAPTALPLDRPIGLNATQNQILQEDIAALEKMGARDFRVNQQQVNAAGERVGINRPDVQFTYMGNRYHIEYDRIPAPRAVGHAMRSVANDPQATIILKTTP
jgi:hypothetical protein